jgi:hypothetical protein
VTNRFVLPAAASMLADLLLGGAAGVGITLVARGQDKPALTQDDEKPSVSNRVEYGDRCFHGHCLPCDSKQSCLDELPPHIRDLFP